jgi:hypothetical protein
MSILNDVSAMLQAKSADLLSEEDTIKARLLQIERDKREVAMAHNAIAAARTNGGVVPPSALRRVGPRMSRKPEVSTVKDQLVRYMGGYVMPEGGRHYRAMATQLGLNHRSVAATLSANKDTFERVSTGHYRLKVSE